MSGSYSKLLKEKDYLICPLLHTWASLVAQMVKNLLAMPQTWVWSLGQEDPLEKGLSTHFSILAWRIPWTGEPGGLQSMGLPRVGHNWVTKKKQLKMEIQFFAHTKTGSGHSQPTQGYSVTSLPGQFFFFLMATPDGLWDLSSSTRDQTCALCS